MNRQAKDEMKATAIALWYYHIMKNKEYYFNADEPDDVRRIEEEICKHHPNIKRACVRYAFRKYVRFDDEFLDAFWY